MTRSPQRIGRDSIGIFYACCLLGLMEAAAVGCSNPNETDGGKSKAKGGAAGATSTGSGGQSTQAGGGAAGVQAQDNGGTSNATTSSSGGAAGSSTSATGGVWSGTFGECGLPAAGSTGAAKPAGQAGGDLTILNWAGYKGAVTYTFDDANSSQITNYPALQALGVHFTFYQITGKSSASDPIWAQAVKDGHELGNHTKSHYQTGTAEDVDAATTFLQEKFGVRAWTMAAPYGNSSYVSLAQPRFLINRGVNNAIIAPNGNANPFNLPCFIPATGALASDFNSQIDSARAAGGWRVVLVHGFTGGSDGAYQPVSISEFTASVEYAKSLGNMWIDSMVNVGAYFIGQKAVSSVTPTTSGADRTWTWTLPPNFPPGKCLRVTVPGGRLTQGGKEVPWDDHGYYEVALDARSMTLSP